MSKELPPRPWGPSRGAPMPRGAWPTLPQRKARRSRACQKPAAAARWAFHPGLSAVLSRFPAGIRTPTEPPLLGGGVSRLAPARLLPRTEKALSARPGCPLTAASVVSGPCHGRLQQGAELRWGAGQENTNTGSPSRLGTPDSPSQVAASRTRGQEGPASSGGAPAHSGPLCAPSLSSCGGDNCGAVSRLWDCTLAGAQERRAGVRGEGLSVLSLAGVP
ncbi:uncharacterized protein LOC118881348 [Balaenoptera musculus]|uniref:Uncharacterized protein LOC118881348 n=1 Tax=Balaenoptera musculus TaxID=9771 RepID=A0A8B8VB42_BALMU|nr:uncharacterized protein LOC118881348 [Balaenoptera musculus]